MRRSPERSHWRRLAVALAGALALVTAFSSSALAYYADVGTRNVYYPHEATTVIHKWAWEADSGFHGCVRFDVTATVNTGTTTATSVYIKSVKFHFKIYDNAYVREHSLVPGAMLRNFRIIRKGETKYQGEPWRVDFDYPGGSITYQVNKRFVFSTGELYQRLQLYTEIQADPSGPAPACTAPYPTLYLQPKKDPYT